MKNLLFLAILFPFFAGAQVKGVTASKYTADSTTTRGLITANTTALTALTQPSDYIIESRSGTYYARPRNGSSLTSYSGSDPTTVFNSAISAISSTGGEIVLDASINLTDELTITGIGANSPHITIEGKSKAITITQNTASKNVFVVKNGASVTLRNLTISVSSSSKSAILGDSTGANTKMAWYEGGIDNVNIFSQSTTPPLILRNFYYLDVPYIYIHGFNSDGLVLENTTSANNYGNSRFGNVVIDVASTKKCLVIQRNGGGTLDHISFDNLNLYDGLYGVWTDYAAYIDFGHIDFEYGGNPMRLGDNGGHTVFSTVRSALFTSNLTTYTGIYLGSQSFGNTFNNITFNGPSNTIVPISDNNVNNEPNSFVGMMYDGADYSANVYINQNTATPYSYKLGYPNTKTSVYLPSGTTTTTPTTGDNSSSIATTAFVKAQGYATVASPAFTGTPSLPAGTIAITQSSGDNTTKPATTAFVNAERSNTASLTNKTISGSSNTLSNIPESAITNLTTDLASKSTIITGTRFIAPIGYLPVNDGGYSNDPVGANVIDAVKFYLPYQITFTTLQIIVRTAGTTGANIYAGIYDASGNKIIASSGIGATTTGLKSSTVSTTTLTPGFYWASYVSTDNAVRIQAFSNSGSAFWDNTIRGVATNNVSGGVMPATLGAIAGYAGNNGPLVMLQ